MADWGRFRVKKYAQTDEESVLLNLVDHFSPLRYVVDIGAGDGYSLSNSQLFVDDGWSACRLDVNHGDGSDPTLHRRMVTQDNVCEILGAYDVPKNFGMLSLDIDGVDLYVLHSLLSAYIPSIIVFEINACRDPASFDVVKYDPEFKWAGKDYYGASWSAFCHVLDMRGYVPVWHSNSLNGYAVDARLTPERVGSAPKQDKYHGHDYSGEWLDARYVFYV